jgi:hypothetical protein
VKASIGINRQGLPISATSSPHQLAQGGWFAHRHDRKRRGGPVKGAFAGPELADATLGWMLRTFRVHGDNPEPDKVIAYQVQRVLTAGGCSDPAFWEMVALDYARSGREGDLAQAIAACEEGTRQRPAETTASAWRSPCQTAEIMRLRLVRQGRLVSCQVETGTAVTAVQPSGPIERTTDRDAVV